MMPVNVLAVIAAAASSFLLGGLWYSRVLFGEVWTREAGASTNKERHRAVVFVVSWICWLIAAWLFAIWLPRGWILARATTAGFLVGLVFVAGSFGVNYAFGGRSFRLWLIDAGYHTLQFTLYGLIIGAWRA